MSMFNYDGQLVASAIINGQAADTFIDILQSRRDAKRTGGPTAQDYVNLLNAYNQLVARFNRVIESDKIENEKNRQIDLGHVEAIAAKDARILALENDFDRIQRLCNQNAKDAYDFACELSEANQKLKNAGL